MKASASGLSSWPRNLLSRRARFKSWACAIAVHVRLWVRTPAVFQQGVAKEEWHQFRELEYHVLASSTTLTMRFRLTLCITGYCT